MKTKFLTESDVVEVCERVEPEVKFSAHLNGLPYIPLIPSLKAYALIETNWGAFMSEYKRAARTSMRSGLNFTYID